MQNKKILHYTDTINYELEKTAKVMKLLSLQLFKNLEIELQPDEYIALDTISCHDGICQRDLAKLIIKDRATTGKIVSVLEEKGLITRFVDTKNNRLVRKMAITEKGYKKIVSINKKIEGYVKNTKRIVSEDEMIALRDAIKRLRETFKSVLELNI